MDGTFDSAPYPFKQVFCISVVSASGRIVPVLWALLNSKSKTKKDERRCYIVGNVYYDFDILLFQ